jgi:hypothetical protein
LVYALLVVALVIFALGVVYLLEVPKDLPSFLPGHVDARAASATARSTTHYSKRAAMAFLASAAMFIWAMSQSWTLRRWRHSR